MECFPLSGAVLGVACLLIVWQSARHRTRTAMLAERAAARLATCIAERDVTIREMHHRVGNMAANAAAAERLIDAAGDDRERVAQIRAIAVERMEAMALQLQEIADAVAP